MSDESKTYRTTITFDHRGGPALKRTAEREGAPVTDVVNRAVVLYDRISVELAAGTTIKLEHPDGTTATVWLI